MQEENFEASTSISQLLRDSYLSDVRIHQGHGEKSRSEAASKNFYRGTKPGVSQDLESQGESSDLSAFLSQEELDESVNLAQQAIAQCSHESKKDNTGIPGNRQVDSSGLLEKPHHQPFHNENVNETTSSLETGYKKLKEEPKSPLVHESEAKKDYLSKAADFIEELSSLFKTQSSKRIRPRACKSPRSRSQSKTNSQSQKSSWPVDERERSHDSIPVEKYDETISNVESEEITQTSILASDTETLTPEPITTETQSTPVYIEETKGNRPRFIQKLKSREAPEGSRVQLDCTVTGIPTPEVRWYCEGKELQNSPDLHIVRDSDRYSLIISEAFEEDTGRYTCLASNIYGSDATSAEIYIEGVSSSESELDSSKDDVTQAENNISVPFEESTNASNTEAVHSEVEQIHPTAAQPLSQPLPLSQPIQQIQSPTNFLQGLDGLPLMAAPVFTKPLQDVTATEGQLVVLECRVKGVPFPKMEWYREETLIEDSPDFRILQKKPRSIAESEEICTLVIAEAFPEDSGTFTCTASNKYGTVSSTAHLTVTGIDDGNAINLNAVSTVTVEAIEHSVPAQQEVSMSKPTVLLKPKLEGVLVNHHDHKPKAHLRVHFKLPEDDRGSEPSFEDMFATGLHAANGQNIWTSAQGLNSPTKEPPPVFAKPKLSAQGILKKAVISPRTSTDHDIRDSKDAVMFDLERKLRLKDDVFQNGQQRLTYEDKLARRFLGPNSSPSVVNFGEVEDHTKSQDFKYLIESTRNSLGQQQEYKVSNFEQRLMNEIEFRLERTPVEESDDEIQHEDIPTGKCIAPIFDKKLKHFRVVEGSPVTFSSKVVGIPVPKVYWFKDGKQISKKDKLIKMKREGDGVCSLYIKSATNDDDGNYTIMAANPQGRISCSGHLMVQSTPRRGRSVPPIQNQRTRSRVLEGEEPVQERFFRPHFLQATGDMVAHEGRFCRLDCKVSGLPNPDLIWLLNGKLVLPDACHRMLVRENGIHSILIDPLSARDGGTYTCIATNKAGQSSFSLELSVVAKEITKAPVFIEKLQNVGVAEGCPIRLECRVLGMPPPTIFWKKDNETISPTKERINMHQDTTGYVCLLIQPTKKEDAGWYTVSAKNEAGIVSCTARLDLYAQWHQQIQQPIKKVRPSGSRYAALTDQGLDVKSAFPTVDSAQFSSKHRLMESDEL
ncbi:myopalladin isoform X3 [Callorhinchus milii]|uniref:myopalladin isoform X3 n=1 Tax=Callorhinchus milii TaxID=7868 RepID=UPI001C3F8855|nr:myopalladin isoform X3 [Callorhinchus milii]